MSTKLSACLLMVGIIGITGAVSAQDLGPFPVDRVRETPETDLITNARLSTTSFGFLKLATNARAAGMGDAYSAVGNDLSSVFYNPAGITQMETNRAVVASYTNWIVGSSIGSAAFAVKTPAATIGVSVVYLQSEEFEERTSSNPGGTGRMVRGTDTAIGVTLARQLTDKLSFAGQFRWVKEDLDLVDFSTVDINFGTLFYTGYRSTRLSMTLRNLGADKEVVAQKARVPTVFYISGAGEVYGNLGDPFSLTASIEQAFYTDFAARYYFGAEAWFSQMFALRAGYKTRHDAEDWSVGAGVRYEMSGQMITADVSFSHADPFGENPLRLTVGYGF